jgi:glutamine synthetase
MLIFTKFIFSFLIDCMKKPIQKPSISEIIKEQQIKFISYRFSDINGIWHQITKFINPSLSNNLEENLMIDGSSVEGWNTIENSDIILKPDISTFFVDPFCVQPTAIIICDLLDTETKKPYIKDPRSIAKLAEGYFQQSEIGDTAYFGVEPEFFIFDDVRYNVLPNECSFRIAGGEMESETNKKLENGNLAHKMSVKGGYNAVSPLDSLFDIRSEMLTIMEEVGLTPILHHHEVAQNQCEVGFLFNTMLKTADNTQKCKFVIKNVSSSFGKTATFMAKPLFGENGSGMHIHHSIWKGGKNLFAGKEYADLSKTALSYIAGILHFAKSIAAFSNPTVNSYRRLVPTFEAPTTLSFSAKNRSAGIRIPFSESENGRRIETRFPDPTANPYLVLSAMLMAGIYGIKNKLKPEKPRDENLYKSTDVKIEKMPASLEEALNCLEAEHSFLLEGGVFTKEFIQSYIKLKRGDVLKFQQIPHPLDYKLYYGY